MIPSGLLSEGIIKAQNLSWKFRRYHGSSDNRSSEGIIKVEKVS
jgi:hypothetical protein